MDNNDKPKTDLALKPIPARTFSLMPSSLGEAMDIAKLIAESDFAPKDYKGKPGNVMIAIQMGADVGLKPMQSLQNIAVINGRPSIWGDAAAALVQSKDILERFHETIAGDGDTRTATCILKRKGWPDEIKRTVSVADAKKANLWGKVGPWQTYPDRMLQMRARGFALRDGAADCLMGLILAEEADDYPDAVNAVVVASEVVTESPLAKLPEVDREHLDKAFDLIHASPALQLQKVNEYLGGETPQGIAALLEWCRNEFAAQKGRTREKVKDTNGKAKAPTGTSTPAVNRVGPSGGELSDQSVPSKKAKTAVADLEF